MRWLCSFGKMFQSNTCLGCASAGYHIAAVVIHSDRDNYFDHHGQCLCSIVVFSSGTNNYLVGTYLQKKQRQRKFTVDIIKSSSADPLQLLPGKVHE